MEFWAFSGVCQHWCIAFAGSCVDTSLFVFFHVLSFLGWFLLCLFRLSLIPVLLRPSCIESLLGQCSSCHGTNIFPFSLNSGWLILDMSFERVSWTAIVIQSSTLFGPWTGQNTTLCARSKPFTILRFCTPVNFLFIPWICSPGASHHIALVEQWVSKALYV